MWATDIDPELETLRSNFKESYRLAQRGRLAINSAQVKSLRDYALYPDLLAAHFNARLSKEPHARIEAYLTQYDHLRTAQNLRRKWLRRLAAGGHWQKYLEVYTGESRATYQCLALTARLRMGELEGVSDAALPLWMIGKSQVKQCDPVFEYLELNGDLTADRRRARLFLALNARELDLASYLAKTLTPQDQAVVKAWQTMRSQPGQELVARNIPNTSPGRALFRYGIERLARKDPFHAWKVWSQNRDQYNFTSTEQHDTSRFIAVRSALSDHPSALRLFSALAPEANDETVARWRVRLALKQRNWYEILDAIEDMPANERTQEKYRYWNARALGEIGDQANADLLFGSLSSERSYYGFLSADRIGRPYSMNHQSALVDEDMIARLEDIPTIIRARELFALELFSLGRSAWNDAMAGLSDAEKEQAAIMAHRWGWHSRAIAVASANGLMDDLEIRYPLAFQDLIVRKSKQKKIDATWAFGIARSESLFMPDVVSKAGALGLMQVMPATGKNVAKRNKVPYSNWRSLLNPNTNVTLGTTYLRDMRARFSDNSVLASAAYNAGPHRVQRWLPKEETEADIWVDMIPFKETQGYVKRVMAAQIIFHWRLTGDQRRLAATMPTVQPASGATKGSNSVAAF